MTARIPLGRKPIPGSSRPCVRAFVPVHIRTSTGIYNPEVLRLDTGSDVTSMTRPYAEAHDIPFPVNAPFDVTVHTSSGPHIQRRYGGEIRLRIPAMSMTEEFVWPCHFIDTSESVPPVIGMCGLLDDLIIRLDGRYDPVANHGWLTLERV